MSAEDAFSIFETIGEISGTLSKLHLWQADEKELADEEEAEEVRELNLNRHNFKGVTFTSSLTNKTYYSKTNRNGSLGIYLKDNDEEVKNYSRPSKKQMVRRALIDLGLEGDNKNNLYQLMHQLEKELKV